jgi:hypothetical protein
MQAQVWHLDLMLGLCGAVVAVAALALAGPTPGGIFTASVGGGASAVLLPMAAAQMRRGRSA